MQILTALTTHYSDPTYDRIKNPARRSIAELLPIAISWQTGSQHHRIDFATSGIACPLADMSGMAVVDGSFAIGMNRAYVVNADGSERFTVLRPDNSDTADVFSDVYNVEDLLSFFVSGRSGDRRIECDVNMGKVLRVVEAR